MKKMYIYKNNNMSKEQAAKKLVDQTFHALCFEKSSFSSKDVRRICIDLIDKEIEKTAFLNEIIGE